MKEIFVKKSAIHGRGVFVNEDVKKGELVSRVKGPIVRRVEKTKRAALAYPDLVGISGITRTVWIDPQPPYKYLNHSCDPSCGIRGKIGLYALRDLKRGDEITFDYSTVVGNPLWEMACRCGKKNCRKMIRSIQHLNPKYFQRYLPHIPTHFQKIYLKYTKRNAH